MQILTKRVKLDESDSEVFIKSKWTETTVEFEVLVKNKNVLLTSSHLKEDLLKKKYIKVTFDQLFKSLSSTSDEQFHFEYNKKFEVFKVEPIDEDETYQICYLSLPDMKETKLTEDVVEIIARQLQDLAAVCDKFESQSRLLEMVEVDMENLTAQYFTLSKEKEEYDRNTIAKCCALLNEKKKFIRDGTKERVNDSSFDIHEFIINDGLKVEHVRPTSPVPSTSNYASKNVTPKSSSTQKRKRTPSKKLFAQISQQSDSDDISFDILPDETSHKKISTENDTSSIFKDFKVKTPKKFKREEKESSIEAKMNDNSIRPRELSSPDVDTNPLDVFKCSDDILSQAIDQEMEDLSPPKKNPYSIDTINILEM